MTLGTSKSIDCPSGGVAGMRYGALSPRIEGGARALSLSPSSVAIVNVRETSSKW